MPALPPTIGGKYRVVRRLGKGGMGTVYEAIADDTRERVAVKVIAADLAEDRTLVTRFQREARTVMALDTLHIVKTVEFGADPVTNLPFMVMEYLEGEDLRQLLKRLGPLPPVLALSITAQACRALEAAHGANVLHRDIKPANLYLAMQDGERIVKLLDFGVAKAQHPELTGDAEMTNLTRTGSMVGSPLYMSPEQARGYKNIDGRSDIFSLGVVLYQMLAGHTPHAKIEELGELLVRICTEPPPPIQRRAPWVPPTVAEICHLMLAMDAEDRFPNATVLLQAIERFLPDGGYIPEDMLRSLTDAERGPPAPEPGETFVESPARQRRPHSLMGTGANPTGASGQFTGPRDYSGANPELGAGLTGAGLMGADLTGPRTRGQSFTLTNGAAIMGDVPAEPPEKKQQWRIAAVGLVAGLVAAGVYFGFMRPSGTSGQDASPAATTADAKPRAVKLVILPKDATVEVDGAAAALADGLVEISGTLGSVHKVRVSSGVESKVVEVAITENGPSPAKIEVEAPKLGATPSPSASTDVKGPSTPGKPRGTSAATAAPTATHTGRALRDDR